MLPHFLSALLLALLCYVPASAEDWTRFRGPNGTGASDADGIPVIWTEADYNWKVELPGRGHSSPIVFGKKLFITSGDLETGDQLVLCLSTQNGSKLWERRLKSLPHHLHTRNSFASSTPAVDEKHVYVAWAHPEEAKLTALDHSGQQAWEISFGQFKSQHGYGTSPVVIGEMVVLGNDQMGESFLMAVDRNTGKTLWKSKRTPRRTAYSTPCLRTRKDGSTELIFNSGSHGISGIDPETGKTNWEIFTFDKRSVSSPIVVGDLVYGSCGSGGGGNYIVAVKPADVTGGEPEIAYKIDRSAPYVPSPIAYGDLVFLWYDKGVVTCIDAPTGKMHYQERVGGNYSGSPVRVKDRIYCMSDEGECVVIAADKQFKLLAKIKIGDLSRSTPAVADGRMFLRTQDTLVSIGNQEAVGK